MQVAEITLNDNVIVKKNNRALWENEDGRQMSAPSKDFKAWQKSAMIESRMQCRTRFIKPVSLEVIVYFGTKHRSDLDNRLTSILDMLVECVILKDDSWLCIPLIQVQAEYRKKKPGAFIRITEL